MRRLSVSLALFTLFVLAAGSKAADATLSTAAGKVEKAGKGSVTIQTRRPDGAFGKSLTLKITDSSDFSSLSVRKDGAAVQRKAKASALKKNATVAVIYTTTKKGTILLSAVIHSGK